MQRRPLPPPNIEESLCAAAHGILTDGRRHRPDAQLWALRQLQDSTPSGVHTAFTRAALRRVVTARTSAPIPVSTTPRRRGHVPT
jgi:hypothetical protein